MLTDKDFEMSMGIQCDFMASWLQSTAQCNEWLYIPPRTNGNNADIQVYSLFFRWIFFYYGSYITIFGSDDIEQWTPLLILKNCTGVWSRGSRDIHGSSPVLQASIPATILNAHTGATSDSIPEMHSHQFRLYWPATCHFWGNTARFVKRIEKSCYFRLGSVWKLICVICGQSE